MSGNIRITLNLKGISRIFPFLNDTQINKWNPFCATSVLPNYHPSRSGEVLWEVEDMIFRLHDNFFVVSMISYMVFEKNLKID